MVRIKPKADDCYYVEICHHFIDGFQAVRRLYFYLLNYFFTRYYGENVEDIEEATRFKGMVQETFRIGGATNIGDFLPALKLLVRKLEKSLIVLQENRDEFMQELIKDCRKRMEKEGSVTDSEIEGNKKCLIEVLLTLQENEPEYYKDEIIRSLMLVSSLLSFYFNFALISFLLFKHKYEIKAE